MEKGKEINILPLPEDIIEVGMTLIIQGELEYIEKLRDIADGSDGRSTGRPAGW